MKPQKPLYRVIETIDGREVERLTTENPGYAGYVAREFTESGFTVRIEVVDPKKPVSPTL